MFWLIFFLCLFVLIIAFSLWVRKYKNPYKLIMVFGKKGCGKSTTLCKLAIKYKKKGWIVYSTEHTPFTYYIEPSQIGYVHLEPHSVLLVDEVGMVWDNRQYRDFKPQVRDFFKLQRHYKVRCYLFSQTFDIDKKLRDLTDQMFLLRSVFTVFSYGKRINRRIVLTKSEADKPSTISEDLVFDSFLLFWAGSRFFTYIPKYAKYFNSFEAPALQKVNFTYEELPENLKKKSKKVHTRRTRSGSLRLFNRFFKFVRRSGKS